jgi:hypothetical protein
MAREGEGRMGRMWTRTGDVDWTIELERDRLLPGRLVAGRVTLVAHRGISARALIVALVAEEHWQHEDTTTDGQGSIRTETVTTRHEQIRQPVQVSGPLTLAAGGTQAFDLQLPVPPMGPASLDATVAGLDWTVEAKLDVPDGFDSGMSFPIMVCQPVALLRAGAVDVGAFALYPAADAAADGASGSIALDPLPLGAGAPFRGTLTIRSDRPRKLQEIRAEIRVRVEATVASRLKETIVAWSAIVAAGGDLTGERAIPIQGVLEDRALPTIELPHGRASASFHVILATAWASDPHLVRDVTIATTLEL